MDLVEAMAVARWRLRRIWANETSLLAHELERRAEDMDEEFTDMSADDRLAWVFPRAKGAARTQIKAKDRSRRTPSCAR